MLFVTDVGEQVTVKCSCGCFSLSVRNPTIVPRGVVRCLICGTRAPISTLIREWLVQPEARAERAVHWGS
ncbi:MAG: hypothetical protein ACE5GS_16950 [Kiloniellaceae bacterium]